MKFVIYGNHALFHEVYCILPHFVCIILFHISIHDIQDDLQVHADR